MMNHFIPTESSHLTTLAKYPRDVYKVNGKTLQLLLGICGIPAKFKQSTQPN